MKGSRTQTKPLARKDGLIVQALPDEVLVYDLDRDQAHCLNDTAAFVWQRCDGRTTTKEIAASLGKKVSAPVDENIVWLALDQLDQNNLLARHPTPPAAILGMNRREMVRALGIAAVVAVPVVTSIVAPRAAQAATCIPSTGTCQSSAQCCSGLCNAGACA
jgi:hypothetical protein